ncbi:MAG: SIMPL domain-containing protein [Candidatus Blackburnbacteria bacterium]|nr:SIMPL domain-containing protein [Candidatus Blackburnbacteria bacterium]
MGNRSLLALVAGAILFFGALFTLPFSQIDWGNVHFTPGKTITVTGQSQTKQKNQVANFTAGVNAVNDNKDQAVGEVNKKMTDIIKSVKDFGVKSEDIQTQNISVYQTQESYYDADGRQKTRPGQWQVSNSIQITLRDVSRASDFANLLTASGANNVYGPNFSLESSKDAENQLLQDAIEDAKKKAATVATASGGKLGKVISVTEGTQSYVTPLFAREGMGGGGAPTEPGSTTTGKTVTVVFQLQ